MNGTVRGYWPPLAAGIVLGLVLLITFMVTAHGLGASGFFTALAAGVGLVVDPQATAANSYLGGYAGGNPLARWITFEILGVFAGAIAGACFSGRFKAGIEKGPTQSSGKRLLLAFAGGMLVGAGSRFARGCTSGLGLSGGATLAVAAFIFLIAFFAAGFATMALVRRQWQ